jgi:hypothetical protein
MSKKGVRTANHAELKEMEKQGSLNRDTGVWNANARLFGKQNTTVWHDVSIGFDSGLSRVIL